MLWYPFPAVWGNYFLDVVDGDILLSLGVDDYLYQTIDKFADYWSYIFMLILGLRWKIRRIIIILFAYRTIGQILFFLTRNELVFMLFQNFLEPLVMAYSLIIFKQKSEDKAFRTYKRHFKLIWAVVIGYKLWNEWYLHYANIDLSLIFFGFTGGQ
jgi:hypothetical protein